jgi:protein-S-isoprenylcysteine O-methyltransferase Ste14
MSARGAGSAAPQDRPLLRIPVPWVYVLGFLLGVGLQALVPVRIHPRAAVTELGVCGGIIFLLGATLAGWSWWLFKRAGTTAVPGEAPRALVTTGPYRLTRNPMYAGLAVAYAGDAIAIPEFWALAFLPFVLAYVNWSVIPVEEISLNDVPGYDHYRAKVRRWI